jgi:hypothetical protein
VQPTQDGSAQIARAKVIIGAELLTETIHLLKSLNEPAVMLPITRQTEFFEHFGT